MSRQASSRFGWHSLLLWSLQEKGCRRPAGHSHHGGRTCRPGGPESSPAFPRPHGDWPLFCLPPGSPRLPASPPWPPSLQEPPGVRGPSVDPVPHIFFPFCFSQVLCPLPRSPTCWQPSNSATNQNSLGVPHVREGHQLLGGPQGCKLDLEGTVSPLPQTSSSPRSPCSLGCAPLLPASYRP